MKFHDESIWSGELELQTIGHAEASTSDSDCFNKEVQLVWHCYYFEYENSVQGFYFKATMTD